MNASHHFLVALAGTMAWAAQALAAPATITLEAGEQRTWSIAAPVMRAATANNDIVGINVVPPRGVVVTAKRPGTAMVSVWAEGRSESPVSQYLVKVVPNLSVIRPPQGKDGGNATISVEGTKLRLSGALNSLEQHAQLHQSADAGSGGASTTGAPAGAAGGAAKDKADGHVIDATTTRFDVQVRMDVKIVEVSRQKLKEHGFYYQRLRYQDGNYMGSTGFSGPDNYQGFTRETAGYKFQSGSGFVPFTDAFNIFAVSNNVWATFSALEANGFAHALAEPSLTALSGQTATFLAGGEIPVPFRSGADGSISIVYKEFGIRLKLTPTVLDQNRITIKVAPEVSEVDPSLSITTGGYVIPGLKVRRTDTTVALGDGETFIISGLVSQQSSANVDKFPFLGDIPIIGAFFKSSRIEREDKELLMIATPRLVRPFAKNAPLPELPGEEARKYDPNFMHVLLKETGRFEQPDSGFSK